MNRTNSTKSIIEITNVIRIQRYKNTFKCRRLDFLTSKRKIVIARLIIGRVGKSDFYLLSAWRSWTAKPSSAMRPPTSRCERSSAPSNPNPRWRRSQRSAIRLVCNHLDERRMNLIDFERISTTHLWSTFGRSLFEESFRNSPTRPQSWSCSNTRGSQRRSFRSMPVIEPARLQMNL